ncbi:MAG: hypothetical protein HW406_228 [Candidatus Brocadiaceae bacterium]|nr:hypothetical protein [Candidatus Brocadiaceae bacterium]MBM2833067.1 hypothetical protein [Candidatus Brocadiaceae bacterium]
MQDKQSCLCDYFGEEQAIAELGIEASFFKYLFLSKRLKFYLLTDGDNGEPSGKRFFKKSDIEAVKKTFCSLIVSTKTCPFICQSTH